MSAVSRWSGLWCRRGSGRAVLLSLLVVLTCNALLVYFHQPFDRVAPGVGTPDLLALVPASELYAHLELMGVEGRRAYLPIAYVDMVYPLAYGAFMLLALGWGLADRATQLGWLGLVFWLPVIGVLADYVENSMVQVAIWTWPEPSTAVAMLWMVAHSAKWLALLPCAALTLAVIGRGILRSRAEMAA